MRADGTYLVTGGLGAIGLHVARYLAGRGAGNLVLLGRSDPTEGSVVEDLGRLRDGTEVRIAQADVADEQAMGAVFERIDREMPPLRGIFHAAGILDDGLIVGQTAARFAAVMAPKVRGSWILHRLSLSRPVAHFVLFSSAASIVGSPGQTGYAAANTFMNRLAHFRSGLGLPATSLCWGPWADEGLAARADRAGRLEGRGLAPIAAKGGIRALDRALRANRTELAIMDFRPGAWRDSFPASAALPFFSELPAEDPVSGSGMSGAGEDIIQRLGSAAIPRQRRELLESFLRHEIGRVLRQAPERIGADAPFGSLGLDSLMALEVRNRLEREIGRSLPVTVVWNYPTVSELATFLLGLLEFPLEGDAAPAPAAAEADDLRAVELAAMSEEDVLELLGARLRMLDTPGE